MVRSSEIEGEKLDGDQVRSSIARRLGMDVGGLVPADRDVEGVVEMMLDATTNYAQPLTADRLFGWHAALFPTGRIGLRKITVGNWGNGRIARAIADMALAHSEQSTQRFYSMSAQIRRERSNYYTTLERTQKGTLDITPWQEWFLSCLLRAIEGSQDTLGAMLGKARFWERFAQQSLNARQVSGALRKDPGGGRSTSYSLIMGVERK